MAQPNSTHVIQKYNGFGGSFVDSQYLGASYQTGAPHKFMDTLMRVYSSKNRFMSSKSLLSLLGGKTKEIDNEIYQWQLEGAEYKSARSLGIVDPTNTTPGLNNTPFRIKLDLDYYHRPDVLFSEDNEYPLAIVDGPIQEGNGYVYTVRIQGDDPAKFIPQQELETGKEFCKVWTSTASENNGDFGTQQYPASFKLESQLGFFSQKVTVTDKAWRDSGKIGFKFSYTDYKTGKRQMVESFLPMMEHKMHEELYRGMNAQGIYGVKQTVAGPKDYWIKTGDGIRRQMRDGWTEYFNGALTTDRLKDYLLDIFFSRESEVDRQVTVLTGTLGSLMFHDMLASEASSFLTVDEHFVRANADSAGLHNDASTLTFGAQYTRYNGPEGIFVNLMKIGTYDDKMYCKRMHPQYPGKPIDSARFTFLDFGSSEGDSNVCMLRQKDTYMHGYVPGTHTPTGPIQGGAMGGLTAGYDMATSGSFGVWIKDTSRTGELIYDYEA